jgi:hypothetical protein
MTPPSLSLYRDAISGKKIKSKRRQCGGCGPFAGTCVVERCKNGIKGKEGERRAGWGEKKKKSVRSGKSEG